MHLLHDVASMKFDRLLCTPQLSADLLIQKSGHNQSHYLALARREGIEPTLQVPQLRLLGSSYAVTLEALRDVLPKAQAEGVRLAFASELVH